MAHTVRIYSGLLSRRLASRYVFQGNSYPRFMRHRLTDQYSQKRRPGTRQSFVKKPMIQNNKNVIAHSHSWVIWNEQKSVWLLVNINWVILRCMNIWQVLRWLLLTWSWAYLMMCADADIEDTGLASRKRIHGHWSHTGKNMNVIWLETDYFGSCTNNLNVFWRRVNKN